MKKIFIEESRIKSLIVDICEKIEVSTIGNCELPIERLVIIGVGESGTILADKIFQNGFSNTNGYKIEAVSAQESNGIQILETTPENKASITPIDSYLKTNKDNVAYIVTDGVCRSGKTLSSLYNELRKSSKNVWTYSVAVCSESIFIPSWYGFLYEPHEYVELERNNRTNNTALSQPPKSTRPAEKNWLKSPALALRKPQIDDPEFNPGGTADSISRYKSEDRFFDSITKSKSIFVIEWHSTAVGFIAFHIEKETLWIDYIVACQNHTDKRGIGIALYTHIENYAKMRCCHKISLYSISDKVETYKKWLFTTTSNTPIEIFNKETGKSEKYYQMTNNLTNELGQYIT